MFGRSCVATPILIKDWKPISAAIPVAISLPLIFLALWAIIKHCITIIANNAMTITLTINPVYSPITEKIKSVCCSDTSPVSVTVTSAIVLLLSPFPESCPEPMAITEFCC